MGEHDDRDAAIFVRVREMGATRAIVTFAGGGDEGWPESLQLFAGDRDISPADPRRELLDELGAPIYDEWGSFAGEFHVDGRLHIDAEAQAIRLETTNLVEGEDYERQARDEELCYLVSEAGATRAELPYTWHDGRVAELGAVRLLEFERALDAADALLQQSLADAVEQNYEDAGGQRVVGVVVVDVVGASVEFVEHVREDVPPRGLFGRLRRRNGD